MSRATIVSRGPGHYALEGVLDFQSVASLLSEGESMLAGQGMLDLDLGDVRESNSAGLALLLEWLDLARRRGRAVSRDEILENIWKDEEPDSDKIVAVYIRRLRKKLEENPDKPVHILTVRGYGYKVDA